MDRATMQNIFLYGNPSGPAGQSGQSGNGAGDQQSQPAQQQSTEQQQAAAALEAQQQQLSGYPALMQQYLLQQQQSQQQMAQQAPGGVDMSSQLLFAQLQGAGGGAAGLNLGQQAASMPAAGAPTSSMPAMDMTSLLAMQHLQQQAAMASQAQQQGQWMGAAAGGGAEQGQGDHSTDQYGDGGLLAPWSSTSAGLLGKMATTNAPTETKVKKTRKKPKDKPKRPLSAYNIFFKEERARILEKIPKKGEEKEEEDINTRKDKKRPHGKIGFESLAKQIGQAWQNLEPDGVEYYKKQAEVDMKRYKKEMEGYLSKQAKQQEGGSGKTEDEGAVPSEEQPAKKLKTASA